MGQKKKKKERAQTITWVVAKKTGCRGIDSSNGAGVYHPHKSLTAKGKPVFTWERPGSHSLQQVNKQHDSGWDNLASLASQGENRTKETSSGRYSCQKCVIKPLNLVPV